MERSKNKIRMLKVDAPDPRSRVYPGEVERSQRAELAEGAPKQAPVRVCAGPDPHRTVPPVERFRAFVC